MTFILLAIVVFIAITWIGIYNWIVSTKNNVIESEKAIDTVFQNRYDLIPNLVEVVKKYASHEKWVLEEVTKLRSWAMSGQEMTQEKLKNENILSGTLKSIFALAENYPELKANENFLNLQEEWTEIEDRMQAARRAYNAAVKALRNKKEMFPSNIVAWMMNIPVYPMFEANEEAKKSLNAKELFDK